MEAMQPMDTYRDQIESSLKTYEASLHTWTARQKVYASLVQIWSGFEQLRRNPIDEMRFEFIDTEIAKQRKKLESCQASLAKFRELEEQMKVLADSTPAPTNDELGDANDEIIMEIREELDDSDNVISATVTPQSTKSLDRFSEIASTDAQDAQNGSAPENRDMSGDLEPPSIPVAPKSSKKKTNKKKKKQVKTDAHDEAQELSSRDIATPMAVSDTIVEHEHDYTGQPKFNIRETSDGRIEITDDPEGYSIGIIPQDLAEMTDIMNEMDWENEDDTDDEDEDEYGRTLSREAIPLPSLLERPKSSQEMREHVVEHNRRQSADPENIQDMTARGKKKLVFAEDLVQGPSQGQTKTPPKSVLKKESSYPLSANQEEPESPTTPIISLPKTSRFKMERSSTDSKIATRHAQPSQAYKSKLESPVSDTIVERCAPMTIELPSNSLDVPSIPRPEPSPNTLASMTEEERDRLYPRKATLADVDLAPEEGTVKAALSIPKMSEEELAAIRKKRELLGKKHRRRKSADPSHPVRSSSWDESQPMQTTRRLSSGENEQPSESWKAARLQRAQEIIKAQDDIAWANAPITPEDDQASKPIQVNPLAEAGKEISRQESADANTSETNKNVLPDQQNGGNVHIPPGRTSPLLHKISPSGSGSSTPNRAIPYAADVIHSPKPRKPPTPERRGSWHNIPSPLRQEIQPDSISKEVQFTSDVIKKLEPLIENEGAEAPAVISAPKAQTERKLPPRQPVRKSSVDPQSVTPTARSPPPENRQIGPLETESQGAVSHYMVRATSKSPPPHIAIHDLLGDTSAEVRRAVKEEATMPSTTDRSVKDSSAEQVEAKSAPSSLQESTQSINGLVEHVYENNDNEHVNEQEEEDDQDDEVDDAMHRKEIAQEYHRLRQRLIQENGGYIKEEEGEFVPLDEEDGGPGHRISRFKAARLNRDNV